jgi:very-short-patch-repair endonuclease
MVKLGDTIDKNMFYGATPLIFERAKVLRENLTTAETKLWDCLKNKQVLGLRFKSQHPISRFIADFYCHQIKLVIEVDGTTHLDEIAQEYDKGRTAEFERFDIIVIRFSNNEIFNDIETVLSTIRQTCTKLIG